MTDKLDEAIEAIDGSTWEEGQTTYELELVLKAARSWNTLMDGLPEGFPAYWLSSKDGGTSGISDSSQALNAIIFALREYQGDGE